MLFSPLAWALFALTLMIALPGALAAPSPKKTARKGSSSTRVTVETYPAMEDGEILPPPPTQERAPIAPKPITFVKYEVVPTEKRGQVMKRMQLCQQLFEVSGRAYDYRSMTTAELEKEMSVLKKDKQSVTLRQDPSGLFRPVDTAPTVEKDPILDAE